LPAALRRADGEPRRGGRYRLARRGHRFGCLFRADGERERHQGVSCRPSGHRNLLARSRHHPFAYRRHAGRRHGAGLCDSLSYDQLVQRITGDTLDKSHRFTDWTRRPLSEAQLGYAISDVTHLRDVYLKLSADLEKRGRTEWMREEMKLLTSPNTY